MTAPERLKRLGQLIDEERIARGWTWPQARQATGVPLGTLFHIHSGGKGKESRAPTYARIEAGFRLARGTIRDFLDGVVDDLQPAARNYDNPPPDAPAIVRNLWNHPDPQVRKDVRALWAMDKVSPEGREGLAILYSEGLSEQAAAGLRRAGLCGSASAR